MRNFILNLILTVLWAVCCGLNVFLALTVSPLYWIVAGLDLALVVLDAIVTKIAWEQYQAQKQWNL